MKGTKIKGCIAVVLCIVVLITMGNPTVFAGKQEEMTEVVLYHRELQQSDTGLQRYAMVDAAGKKWVVPEGNTQGLSARKKQENLPEVYDPRGTEQETPIRNQWDTGSCWAFGAIKALESDGLKKGILTEETSDLSESHLSWYAWTPLTDMGNSLYGDSMDAGSDTVSPYNLGGNALLATFTLANKWGAVSEKEAPFSDEKTMVSQMQEMPESFRTQSTLHLTQSECYDPDVTEPANETDRNAIKKAILWHGAMDVSLYYGERQLQKNSDGSYGLYNDSKGQAEANHCMTIVGWDDTYQGFRKTPKAAGAWLVANSYGTQANDQGYVWVSYYDTSLGEFYTFEGVAGDTYETVFQYDGMGWSNLLGIKNEYRMKTANVFTAETPQRLEAVAFHTVVKNQPYSIDIYRHVSGQNPESGTRIARCSTSGVLKQSGYHTITLPDTVHIAAGETFSVVVSYYQVDGYTYIPIEGQNEADAGVEYAAKKGQSYCCMNDTATWSDTTNITLRGKQYNMHNVCIKVLGNPVAAEEVTEVEQEEQTDPTPVVYTPIPTPKITPVSTAGSYVAATPTPAKVVASVTPGVSKTPQVTGNETQNVTFTLQGKTSYTIGKGESIILPVKVQGGGKVVYSSSKKTVASVNKKGVVKGKKKGKTSITIAAGKVRKKVKIWVKPAPKKIKVQSSLKKLKKGATAKVTYRLSKGTASYHVTYRSSNKKVVKVTQKGKITARRTGTAKITVTTYNGKRGWVKIRVKG